MTEDKAAETDSSPPANHKMIKALTIPPGRLKGSPRCLNCETELKGPFCYYCGQPDKNFIRFFPVLLRELMEDFLDLDSRLMRTLKPLLLHPGKLTRDYLDGRRFRYTPPLRLYIFSSMAFFILAAMLAGDAIEIHSGDEEPIDETGIIQTGPENEADLENARAALNKLEPGLADQLDELISKPGASEEPDDSDKSMPVDSLETEDDSANVSLGIGDDDNGITIAGKPWDRETNPVVIPFMPAFINDWINDEVEGSPQKGKEIEENPNLFVDKMMDVLPAATFVLLPIVALLFKFWYLFSGKYYVEHLILALHNHSFLFIVFLFMMLSNSLASWLDPLEEGTLTEVVFWFNIVLITWTPIYFLLSLKRVYQQSWGLTTGKYLVIGLSYLVLLGLVTSFAAVLSFLLL